MSGYPTDDEPAPFSYMSVPEEIQLTTEAPPSGTAYHENSYMRVPETITLDDPHSFGTTAHIEASAAPEMQPERAVTIEPQPLAQADAAHDDLEQRVHALEQRVQRLEALNLGGMLSRHGNGFWNVLSFASWVMVPLICVFMYQYKRAF